MLSPEQKQQIADRRAELSQRRAAVNEKSRAAAVIQKDRQREASKMVEARAARHETARDEAARAFELKEAMIKRSDELSRRANEHARRARHERQLWREGEASVARSRGGNGSASPSDGGGYAFAKGSVAAPISAGTYARLMDCGHGKTVLAQQSRLAESSAGRGGSASASAAAGYGSPAASYGSYNAALDSSVGRENRLHGNANGNNAQQHLFGMSPSPTPPVGGGAVRRETPLAASLRAPPMAEGITDTYVLQHGLITSGGRGTLRWK